jgi:hypothetical protein
MKPHHRSRVRLVLPAALVLLAAVWIGFPGNAAEPERPLPAPALAWPGETIDSWHGFPRHRFTLEGCSAWVVEPKRPLQGNPWSWCMEFPDAFTERCAAPALLEKGFHHAHIAVGNSFGCPAALDHFDAFHASLVSRGLAQKAVLIGISRGGLYAYRWAARDPGKVAVIYGDAPVCDFRSWPGGKGKGKGSAGDWAELKRLYGFASEEEALAFPGNPVDVLESLARARIALVHVVGDADDVVPVGENTAVVEARYRALGGEIQVIHKPGIGHHPHGLEDPSPVVRFILRRARIARAAGAEMDALHVATEAPSSVLAGEVFEAKITMENAGSRPWGDGLKLLSQFPEGNETWGTSFIILGQGRSCTPGEQIVFASYLKAPATPGDHEFRWRMARNEDGRTFGEPTPPRTIKVLPRPPEPPRPAAPARDPSRKAVLAAGDLEYAGSFKLPESVDGCGSAFTESGLAFRKAGDGSTSLFVRTGLGRSVVYEAGIPEPAKLASADHSVLKTAPVLRVWGEIALPKDGEDEIGADAGFWWDEETRTLTWSYYHGYATRRYPVLGASRLVEGKVAHLGPWRVPDSIPWFKAYWGGVTRLPREFADRYTGGRTLALGFGGYYSIVAAASRGPALAAIAEPVPGKPDLDMVELLAYPWEKEFGAPRDGDYFVANSSWGGRQPEAPERGWWTMDDAARAGAFIDLPDKHGLLVLAYLATGRIGYDYGAITSAGDVNAWYFYDPEDLGAAAKGLRKPWEVIPSSWTRVAYPRGIREGTSWGSKAGDATGACFEADSRRLYIYQRFTIDVGSRELFPAIHIYRVK